MNLEEKRARLKKLADKYPPSQVLHGGTVDQSLPEEDKLAEDFIKQIHEENNDSQTRREPSKQEETTNLWAECWDCNPGTRRERGTLCSAYDGYVPSLSAGQ